MNKSLENYEPGRPENKPELMKQLKIREDEMNKRREEYYKNTQMQTHIDALRNEYEKKLGDKNLIINELLKKVKTLTTELADYKLGKNV
jgi:hypothetical protein